MRKSVSQFWLVVKVGQVKQSKLMRYLAYMGGRSVAKGRTIEQRILESNLVLEAFGDAKTVRNNNSSRLVSLWRFSLIRGEGFQEQLSGLIFRKDPVFVKCLILRNYHRFYMFCDASAENVQRSRLGKAGSFHYLNQSNRHEIGRLTATKDLCHLIFPSLKSEPKAYMHAVTMAPGHSHLEDKNIRKILVVNKQTNLVLRSSLMIHMKAFDSRHHLAELKAMLRRELKVWSSGLCLEGNRNSAGGSGSLSDNSSRDSVANETSAASRTDKPALERRDKKCSSNNNGPEVGISRCCVVL